MGWDFSLSASKLNILKDCPLCFWLHMVKKVERPRGIFPSLPGGMDRALKAYMDQYRGSMPPELVGKVPGVLWGSVAEINKLRNWRGGLNPVIQTPNGSVSLIGALDDLAYDGFCYASVDGKTKGSAVKEGDTEKYYQFNADVYSLLLRDTGKTPSEYSYFFYVWPERIRGIVLTDPMLINFSYQVVKIKTSAESAYETICKATELLRAPKPPAPSLDCEYCNYSAKRFG